MKDLNKHEQTIVKNADWFILNRTYEGLMSQVSLIVVF